VIDLFFSYAHHDEELRNELEVHLSMLKRSGLVRAWHDRRIPAGKDLGGEISKHLEDADVILLLLSPHFLASDYCYESEATRALQRHEDGNAVVIPVILQPCDWLHSPFRKLRATPHDGKPVTKFPNINDAFLQVTQDIREAAGSLQKSESVVRSQSPPSSEMVKPPSGPRSSNLRLKKTFSDHERDSFLDEAYRYIEKFFENSLNELRDRNPGVEFSLKKMTATDFTAAVYVHGAKRTSCHIWLPGRKAFGGDIAYAANDSPNTNSINDGFRVEEDGYRLGLKTTGLAMMRSSADALLTFQGAAEYFWSVFISHLQ
jgi:hypothetical protein